MNDEMNIEEHLRLYKEAAAAFDFTKELAQAHLCIGQHFLNKVSAREWWFLEEKIAREYLRTEISKVLAKHICDYE